MTDQETKLKDAAEKAAKKAAKAAAKDIAENDGRGLRQLWRLLVGLVRGRRG